MSKVRLRYSGFVNYTVLMLSLFTGFAFSVMVTRRLKVDEYGLWSIISSLAAILSYSHTLYGYWVTRYIARGFKDSVKTGLYLSLIFTIALTPLYMLVSIMYASLLNYSSIMYFMLGLPYFYCIYFWYYWGSVTKGLTPELWGYSYIIGEVVKVSLGYLLLVILKAKLFGVILTLISSFIIMNMIMFIRIKELNVLSSCCRVNNSLIKKWLQNTWIPLIDVISGTFYSGEQLVISGISKDVIPSAFLQASRVTASPISYGGALASGLYAKLLAKAKVEDLREILRMIFSINNFTLVTELILIMPILSVFNPSYVKGARVAILLAITTYLDVLTRVLNIALLGTETIDIKDEVSFKELMNSYLVKSPLIIMIRNFSAIFLSIILLNVKIMGNEASDLAATVALSWLLVSVLVLLMIGIIVKRRFRNYIPWTEVVLSFSANILVVAYYLLFKVHEIRVQVFSRDFWMLLYHILIAGLIYVFTLSLISRWFKSLILTALSHLSSIIRKYIT